MLILLELSSTSSEEDLIADNLLTVWRLMNAVHLIAAAAKSNSMVVGKFFMVIDFAPGGGWFRFIFYL